MIGVVEHRPDQVVETTVDAHERSGGGLLDHIDPGDEETAFADQEFAGLEPDLEGPSAGVGVAGESLFDLLGQQFDIGLDVAGLDGDLEPAAQVDEFEFGEMRDDVEEYPDAAYEDVDVGDLAAGMDMKVTDAELVSFYEGQDPVDLVDRYAELAFVVTGGNFKITARQDIGSQSDADGITMSISRAKLFQVGQAIDIYDDPQVAGFGDLVETDAVGGIEYALRGEAGVEGEPDLVDGATVDICAEGADPFQDIDIGEGLAGVEEKGIAMAEGGGQLLVLFFYLFGVIDIEGGAVFFCESDQVVWRQLLCHMGSIFRRKRRRCRCCRGLYRCGGHDLLRVRRAGHRR